MDSRPGRDERLVFDLDVSAYLHAAHDHVPIADLTVVSDVPAGHDEVVVANHGSGFRRGGPRNREMFTDFVTAADAKITALAGEMFIERMAAKHRAGRDLVAISQRR